MPQQLAAIRAGSNGVPGTTFGEQFKGASGDVYKYKSELCTELALLCALGDELCTNAASVTQGLQRGGGISFLYTLLSEL